MQDAVKGQQAGATEHKKEGRDIPIGTDGTGVDTIVDPPPKPPFGGPDGGDPEER